MSTQFRYVLSVHSDITEAMVRMQGCRAAWSGPHKRDTTGAFMPNSVLAFVTLILNYSVHVVQRTVSLSQQ